MAQGHEIYSRLKTANNNEDRSSYEAAYRDALQERSLECGEPEEPTHLHFDDGLILFVELDGARVPAWEDSDGASAVACEAWQQHLGAN